MPCHQQNQSSTPVALLVIVKRKKKIKSDFSFSRLDLYMFVNYIWVIKLRKSQPVLFKYVCIYSKITTGRYCIDCLLSGYNNDQN